MMLMNDGRWKPQLIVASLLLCFPCICLCVCVCLYAKNYRFIFFRLMLMYKFVFFSFARSTLFVTRSAFNRKDRDFVRVSSAEYYERDTNVCDGVRACLPLCLFVPAHLVSGCVHFAWIFTVAHEPRKRITCLSPLLNGKRSKLILMPW